MILGEVHAAGDAIIAYCMPTNDNPCNHRGSVDLGRAIELFGANFEVASDHGLFVSHLRCGRCGRRGPSISWSQSDNSGRSVPSNGQRCRST